MKQMLITLERYGVNFEQTLPRFVGDEDFYEECFLAFLPDENFALLENAVAAGEYEKAFQYAHTLKGVSGNLGLTHFYQAVSLLTEALRGKRYDEVPGLYKAVHAEYLRLREMCG